MKYQLHQLVITDLENGVVLSLKLGHLCCPKVWLVQTEEALFVIFQSSFKTIIQRFLYIAFKLNRCYLVRIAIKIGHFYAGSGRQLGNLPLVPNGLHARIHRNSIQSQLLSNPGSWGRFNWVWGPLWAILQIRPHSSLPSSVLMCVQLLLEQGWAQPFRHNNVRVSLKIVSLAITLTGGKNHSG